MSKTETILELRDIALKLGGKNILQNINASFESGIVHAVVGPNGAGKSTLASVLMGLPDFRHIEGDILFEGKSIKNLDTDKRAKLGITLGWQEPARFDGISIRDFLEASAKDKSRENLEKALDAVGLSPKNYLNRDCDKTLSGGERKRVEIASILVMEPKLTLLDEPDSGIDVEALDKMFEVMQMLKQNGSSVILITHSLQVLKQSERALLMCHGGIRDSGSSEKISSYFHDKCMPCDLKYVAEQGIPYDR
ncbi:MAG: ABC transporter ATP-binding protein [Candidatus Omnitrophota bacterium]|nr:ABC transporter ATP-binding protein [Candidatus Omnitrophota bacterium]MBU3929148.1 ABC transporter ATP-binding protein [bacterium]MBU4122704.1 ABC transporter ATP-binding protein [bacterium]